MHHTTVSLIIATFLIALTHAILPNHWMPFALTGRAQKWSLTKTVCVTVIASMGHSLITVILGTIIAFMGFQITKHTESYAESISGIILIIIGIAFFTIGRFRSSAHDHNHSKFSDKAIVISLFLMLTCSPCVAVLPLFLAASSFNWGTLVALSLILSFTTVSCTTGLTILAYKGVTKINLCAIENYEKEIIGGILSLLGIVFLIIH